ncbi:MAG TPA: thioredoxin domain-containing protein, partial [Thermoleophilia bacterium]|nr:thioredoxin domain-containing protein [Thermoleophilia bacterium]
EERPDVDAIYMEAVQAMTGQGGWPMTMFLTPDGRPFFGGTYFPPRAAHGRPGFPELLRAVSDAWQTKRDAVLDDADKLSSAIARATEPDVADDVEQAVLRDGLQAGFASLRQAFDPAWGGFGRAPKFPQASMLELALRLLARTGGDEARTIVVTTLDAMAAGGIYDHLGGGFARYSTDERWLVPHFEKMLYDQAQLLRAYLHGWQLTGAAGYRQVIEETAGYVLRDLRSPAGGCYSAEDADSEGVEGKFYVWDKAEVAATAPAALDWYGVTESGNFEGRNILFRPPGAPLLRPPEVEQARATLFDVRARRVRPGLDDKVLTEWNAMMAAALAEAGAVLGRPEWVQAAEDMATFLETELRRGDGRWLRSWQADGGARHLAYAADYAWLVDAFTRLAEATGRARWVRAAEETADAMLELFSDPAGAGLFTTGHDAESLFVRPRDFYDGAVPAANSVAAVALLRLGALTGNERFASTAEQIVATVAGSFARQPMAYTNFLAAADLLSGGITEVAVTGDRADLVAGYRSRYRPAAVLAWGERYASPLWEGREDGYGYVCRDFACRAPVDSVDALLAELDGSSPSSPSTASTSSP